MNAMSRCRINWSWCQKNTLPLYGTREVKTMIINDPLNLAPAITAELETVFDPEIPVNIVELGLVYEIITKEDGSAKVIMTLTAPGCPVAGNIIDEVQRKVEGVEGVSRALVELTFDPPWDKSMMSEVARLELGFM
ncbi:FeS assembly SUF system protein [Parapedobacter luteus]|uniref:FeS assembly SUF system protein n=2 Tax=Sphingobacteriaceae TaxID=84566 RepID=A0A1T5A521_9SPHI|nr:FeS assembly SUF system protein [Parapedobacter luteus]